MPPARSISQCPTCEYSGQEPERTPQIADGLNICRACGTKWREISHKPDIPQPEISITKYPKQGLPIAGRLKPAVFHAMLASVLLAVCLLFFMRLQSPYMKQANIAEPASQLLEIDNVSIESFTNSNQPVLVINGRVMNNSQHVLNIPPINLTSGAKGSSGYISRTYRPALQKLSPGASFRFRTTIRKPPGSAKGIELKFGTT